MASALAVRRVLGAACRARPGPPGLGLPPLAAAAAAGGTANPGWARRGVRAGARPRGAAQEAAGREGAAAGTSYLDLDDDRLLKQCQVDNYRASGPGGQHRNKTSSAVRLVHRPTGVMVTATERRSQHENKAVALKRLRTQIAMKVRGDAGGGEEFEAEAYAIPPELAAILPNAKQRLGPKHKDFAKGAKELLDLLVACKLSVADTAKALGLTTGKVSKLLTSDNDLLTEVNRLRQKDGLKPLRK